jgi:hypothetical protein
MTGDDLSTIPGPRQHRNEDMLEHGIWIKHPITGLVHYVNHKAHVRRLLDAGGLQVLGPDAENPIVMEAQAQNVAEMQAEIERLRAQLEEVQHGSTTNDATIDKPRKVAHR